MTVGDFIKKRRTELGLTLEEIGEAVGVQKSTVKKWETGFISNMKRDRISQLACILRVSPVVFINGDISDYNYAVSCAIPDGFDAVPRTVKRPRLGVISCGEPIASEENFDGYDDVPEDIRCDFTLKCEGDSMINARIFDGDIVYIRQQPMVQNGQIAAVLVDNEEKLLKRVYISKNSIVLQAENPAYEPISFSGSEMNRVSIIGLAVGFTSVLYR